VLLQVRWLQGQQSVVVQVGFLQGQQTCVDTDAVALRPTHLCYYSCDGFKASKPVLVHTNEASNLREHCLVTLNWISMLIIRYQITIVDRS